VQSEVIICSVECSESDRERSCFCDVRSSRDDDDVGSFDEDI